MPRLLRCRSYVQVLRLKLCWDQNLNRLEDAFEDTNSDGQWDELDCQDLILDPQGAFETIEEGVFSPDGEGLLLAGISQARPLLIRYTNFLDAQPARLGQRYQKLKGIHWSNRQDYASCNWIGGYTHPLQHKVMHSLRGGLDEVKLHQGRVSFVESCVG